MKKETRHTFKSLLSILLAVCMLASFAAIGVSAAPGDDLAVRVKNLTDPTAVVGIKLVVSKKNVPNDHVTLIVDETDIITREIPNSLEVNTFAKKTWNSLGADGMYQVKVDLTSIPEGYFIQPEPGDYKGEGADDQFLIRDIYLSMDNLTTTTFKVKAQNTFSYSYQDGDRTRFVTYGVFVDAQNQTRAFGKNNKPLKAYVHDNDDQPIMIAGTPELSTTATSVSAPGTYPIFVGSGTLDPRYAPVSADTLDIYRDGILTVRREALPGEDIAVTYRNLTNEDDVLGIRTVISKAFSPYNDLATLFVDSHDVVSDASGKYAEKTWNSLGESGKYLIKVDLTTIPVGYFIQPEPGDYKGTGDDSIYLIREVDVTVDELWAESFFIQAQNLLEGTTVLLDAQNQTRFFAQENEELVGYIHDNSDTKLMIAGEPEITTTATKASDVGTYAIKISKGTLDNRYEYATQDGVLTVEKATLTVTADAKSRAYGVANPELTYTITDDNASGAVVDIKDIPNAPAITLSTTAVASSPEGTYPINVFVSPATPTTAGATEYDTKNALYNIVNSSLVIGKETYTITIADASKLYGEVNPAFSYVLRNSNLTAENQYLGDIIKLEDIPNAPTITLTTTATTASVVGEYPIEATLGAYDTDSMEFVTYNSNRTEDHGTLTINKAEYRVYADDKTKVYGDELPALTYTIKDANGNVVTAVCPLTFTCTTDATKDSDAGTYCITPKPTEDWTPFHDGVKIFYDTANATVYMEDGTLTITKAAYVGQLPSEYDLDGNWIANYVIRYGTPISEITLPENYTWGANVDVSTVLSCGIHSGFPVVFEGDKNHLEGNDSVTIYVYSDAADVDVINISNTKFTIKTVPGQQYRIRKTGVNPETAQPYPWTVWQANGTRLTFSSLEAGASYELQIRFSGDGFDNTKLITMNCNHNWFFYSFWQTIVNLFHIIFSF